MWWSTYENIMCFFLLFGWGFLLSWKKLCFIKSSFGHRWKKCSTLLVLEELLTISYIYGRALYYEVIWERWAIAMIIGENPIPAIYFCCPPPLPPVPINYSLLSDLSAKFQSHPDTVKAKTLCHLGLLFCRERNIDLCQCCTDFHSNYPANLMYTLNKTGESRDICITSHKVG